MGNFLPHFFGKKFFANNAIKAIEEALQRDILEIVDNNLESALEANIELRET